MNEEIQEPQGDPILTIKYDFFDGRKSEEIKFYADPASERRAVATLNDQPTGSRAHERYPEDSGSKGSYRAE